MEVDPEGETSSFRAYRSVIVSDARLTYEGVDAFLRGEVWSSSRDWSGPPTSSRAGSRCVPPGAASWSSAVGSRSTRSTRDGVPVGAGARRSTPARELIEELMVLANESVAKMLRRKKGGVFRVHERPDEESLETLAERLAAVGMQAEPHAREPWDHLPDGQIRRRELPDPALHPTRGVLAR